MDKKALENSKVCYLTNIELPVLGALGPFLTFLLFVGSGLLVIILINMSFIFSIYDVIIDLIQFIFVRLQRLITGKPLKGESNNDKSEKIDRKKEFDQRIADIERKNLESEVVPIEVFQITSQNEEEKPVKAQTKACPSCNSENAQENAFCINCSAKFD